MGRLKIETIEERIGKMVNTPVTSHDVTRVLTDLLVEIKQLTGRIEDLEQLNEEALALLSQRTKD